MKKLTATIAACITLANVAYGQFTLTPEGMKAEGDPQVSLIVERIEGGDPAAMFDAARDFLASISEAPQHTVLTAYPGMIAFKTLGEIGLGGTFIYDVPKYTAYCLYTLNIIFDNEEIRFELPRVSFPGRAAGQGVTKEVMLAGPGGRGRLPIFTRKGVLKEAGAKTRIEEDINFLVNNVVAACRQTVDRKR